MSSDLVKARAIVDAILDNLSDRKGIGNELDHIDADVRQELRDDLIDIVLRELA